MTLTEAFAELPDPRSGSAQRYDLTEMILMALCAVLCGADNWVDGAGFLEATMAAGAEQVVEEDGGLALLVARDRGEKSRRLAHGGFPLISP